MKRNRLAIVGLVALAALSAACSRPGDAYRSFVSESDTAANVTIGPKFIQYVNADPALSAEDKEDWLLLVTNWRKAVSAAQSELNGP